MDLKSIQRKAATLIEALPYIRRFSGERLVVKYGGHAMIDDAAAESFARDVTLLKSVGINVVVVHGGGPQIKATLGQLGIESTFRGGMRVTDDATMDVVQMVLVGKVNQRIVAAINRAGGRAMGLSGVDGMLLRGTRITVEGEDVGRVGKITRVDDTELRFLSGGGFIPVVAPIAVDEDGGVLNINADLAAGAIAAHLMARKLILLTDVDGVKGPEGGVLSSIDRSTVEGLIEGGIIAGGMIPKLNCALDALDAGVDKVHILDGRVRHALLLELFTDQGIGTEVV